MEGRSEIEAMAELAKQLFERYIGPRVTAELLNHSLNGYKATVEANNGDGTLTVSRPFDSVSMTLRCPPALASEAQPGKQVLVIQLGDASNAFILCGTDMSGFGDGGGGGGGSVNDLGGIAQITADRLSTSSRVRKYFLQDTSDDTYLRIQDGYFQFVTGTVTSQTPVQAQDRYGNNLYWEAQPAGHLPDGSPVDVAGDRIYSSFVVTDWPVYTYTYSDTVKASFAYDSAGIPTLTFGEGDANGRTKSILKKASDGFDMSFTDSSGKDAGLKMLDAGYMDLYGLRKPTALNFSTWDNGYFSETVDGGASHTFLVDFDSGGRPVKITDGDGHETTVTW